MSKKRVPKQEPDLYLAIFSTQVSCFDVFPTAWPKGTYGLPMPKSGCPQGSGFTWHKGTRYHDTEDNKGSSDWSSPYDLAGRADKNDMEQKFCMKTQSQPTELSWPKGKYCVFKKGSCPTGEFLILVTAEEPSNLTF